MEKLRSVVEAVMRAVAVAAAVFLERKKGFWEVLDP